MRKIGLLILTLSLGGMLQGQTIAGDWHGTLEFSGMKLRLVFHIQETDGKLSATMDSPDQGANGIPVESIELKEDDLTIKLSNMGISYEAKVSTDQTSIEGTFRQGGATIPLALGRQAQEKPVLNRPQEPKPPYPYREEMVSYENPKAEGVQLAGTLTLPKGDGPFPVVIMISGSGPQDRNEELLGHKPFLVIADHFTKAGIAVLRFDDRGVGKSTGDFKTATSADFATDVAAGINFLQSRSDINPKKIGLVGHSEGGLIAPMVAANNAEVAYIVMMAGPGVSGEKILLLQQDLLARAEGGSEKAIKTNRKVSKKIFKELRKSTDIEQTKKALINYFIKAFEKLPPADQENLGDLNKLAQQQIGMVSSPWFRFFLTYDPAESLQKVDCPVLAINGSKDLQVDAEQNIPAIIKALNKGKNSNFKTAILPNLNHLFQHSETGKSSEYGQLEETFAPEALELMTEWIKEQIR